MTSSITSSFAASQQQWEAQQKVKLELEARVKMNQTISYHFDDDHERMAAIRKARGGTQGTMDLNLSGASASLSASSPLVAGSPLVPGSAPLKPGGSPLAGDRARGGLSAYDMKQKGLVRSGSWRVALSEDAWPELPGGVGVHARSTDNWDAETRECPVIATRHVLNQGKHTYIVQVVPLERDRLLASHGQIRVGFFDSDEDPRISWGEPASDGKAWYYRSIGNVYDGSMVARDHQAPGFEPGDIITATVNMVDNTATFSKRRFLQTSERAVNMESQKYTIGGVVALKLRFGVQFERRCPGVILRDYVDETSPDALYRAKGFKGYGLKHVQRKEFEEACKCFKKAHQFFHAAGDRVLRKEASEMLAEAEVLRDSSIPTPGCTVFRMIGSKPIIPMEAGFAEAGGWDEDEDADLSKAPKEI